MTFVKGHPGGPGRPPLHPELKGIEPMSRTDWRMAFARFFSMTKAQLIAFMQDQDNQKMSDLMIAQVVLKTLQEGDQKRLDFMLDRTIGKVKDIIQVEVPKPYIIRRRDGSTEELGASNPQTKEILEHKAELLNLKEGRSNGK